MHEPYWFPLYARAQELGIPLIVHGTNSLDPRFRVVPHNYQLGFLTEQYLAGQFLSHGDVFARFPELKVIICHCGGALDRFIPTDHHLAQKDLSSNLFYDTCGYDLNFLEAAIKQRGVPRMLFGTEAPGSGRAVRPETGRTSDDLVPVIETFDFLTEEDKIKIFNDEPGPGDPRAGQDPLTLTAVRRSARDTASETMPPRAETVGSLLRGEAVVARRPPVAASPTRRCSTTPPGTRSGCRRTSGSTSSPTARCAASPGRRPPGSSTRSRRRPAAAR